MQQQARECGQECWSTYDRVRKRLNLSQKEKVKGSCQAILQPYGARWNNKNPCIALAISSLSVVRCCCVAFLDTGRIRRTQFSRCLARDGADIERVEWQNR